MQTKTTKLQTLTAELETAKVALAAAKARLQPQIDVEEQRVDGLRDAWHKASNFRMKAYDYHRNAFNDADARLFPEETQKQLLAAVRDLVGTKFPEADFAGLAKEYRDRQVANDAEVVWTKEASDKAYRAYEKALREFNVANSQGSALARLRRELDQFQGAVDDLEAKIERLPRYRAAAAARRAEERRDAIQAEQTQAARELMNGFTF